MSSGKVVQVIGAVIDVEFPRDNVPQVYDALTVGDNALTLEVQQQLGDGVVRAIAMGPSEGVSRGLSVENTGAPISVPVGTETLGRIMDVLGNPIDEKGPIGEQQRASIHRAAPAYDELAASDELAGNRYQSDRSGVPVRQGRQGGSCLAVPEWARPLT